MRATSIPSIAPLPRCFWLSVPRQLRVILARAALKNWSGAAGGASEVCSLGDRRGGGRALHPPAGHDQPLRPTPRRALLRRRRSASGVGLSRPARVDAFV